MAKIAFMGSASSAAPWPATSGRRGHDVTVYNRTATAARWVAETAALGPDPAEAATTPHSSSPASGNNNNLAGSCWA